jgi:hypothetical protein
MTDATEALVYLIHGPDAENGDWVKQSEVPEYANRAAFDVPGDGGENTAADRLYRAFAIEG